MQTEKILKAHDRQIKLAHKLAKVGYNTSLGKLLRLRAYYSDAFLILKQWRDFLYIRKDNIGDKFFAVDQAIMHASHSGVKQLMQVEPQVRGNDLGIIRILAPSYLLNNPLSLGMNGSEHTGIRAVFAQALPNPTGHTTPLGYAIEQCLAGAASRGKLHIGDDLPQMMLQILHQFVFQITLSEAEITRSRAYIKGLALASLPNFISQYLLAFKTAPNIRHRKQLIERYQQSLRWATYLATGAQYPLTAQAIGNSLFDMIHIAGTAGTSALLGSVIGVLCLNDALKTDVVAEMDRLWDGQGAPTGEALEQATLLQKTILETARLYPPVRFVSQLATQGGEVQIGSQKCPFQKGTRLLGSIFTANRDSLRYQSPDTFDLSRDFSDHLSWNEPSQERSCPGRNLSIGIIQIFCWYLLKHYRWAAFTEVKWDFQKVTAVTPNDMVLEEFAQNP
jgi:hypothetical protein